MILHRPITLPPAAFVGVLAVMILIVWFLPLPGGSRMSGAPHLLITEISAAGQEGPDDEDGEASDWIEVTNADDETVDLDGWFLTDSYRALTRWRFPALRLAPGSRVLIHASGKDRRVPGSPLHANFSLDDRGEYLALVRPDGRTSAHEFLPRFPPQRRGYSFGLPADFLPPRGAATLSSAAYRYFEKPTPGAPNVGGLPGLVGDIDFGQDRAFQNRPIRVALSAPTVGAAIYYTTNGAPPDETAGLLYVRPLLVDRTTVLRARAYRDGFAPSDVATRTYLFAASTLAQTGAGFPTSWGRTNGVPVRAHYPLDPALAADPHVARQLEHALRSLPTLSLVASLRDWFDELTGIYANPMESGRDWERPASLEWFDEGGNRIFRTDCGIRIQGGWNRRPEECPKHSLRLIFRNRYGRPQLEEPVFGSGATNHFETLILRGGCNNTWLHWNATERRRGDYIRDQWMRDTSAAMRQPAARGRFVHLYLNGLYWGLYNLAERPDHRFLADHLGGRPQDYDARNADNILSGDTNSWGRLFAVANAGLASPRAYAALQQLLDLDNFIDYILLNAYGANADWDRASNWYAGRRRSPDGRYLFLVWDGERTLEDLEDCRLDFDDDQSPSRLFQKLRENAEFRLRFADRVQHHCFGNGALAPGPAAERFKARARELESAILAESARWGSYRHDFHPYKEGPFERYTPETHWKPEIARLLNSYFPGRTDALLAQLRARGLYPNLDPPQRHRSEARLELQPPARAEIWYTTDGSDPRAPGGQPAEGAKRSLVPVRLAPDAPAIARSRSLTTGEWSARVGP